MNHDLLYIISPYAGDIEKNKAFAVSCCRFAIRQGYTPIAVHLLYPQILNDQDPAERAVGLRLGLNILEHCALAWVCGPTISPGMAGEVALAERLGIPIQYVEGGARVMTLQLALADGRRANIQFQGTMDEAYKAYDGAPFRLDGTESTVCGIRYLPDPVDIREQNVTACFLDDLATAIVFCADFRLHLATYYQNQMGHKIVCTLPSGRQITKGTLFRPKVLLIPGYINVPDDVLYEPIPAELPMKQSRYGAYDPRNLDLIADWCRKLGYHYKFI